jgi:hypothetical protein
MTRQRLGGESPSLPFGVQSQRAVVISGVRTTESDRRAGDSAARSTRPDRPGRSMYFGQCAGSAMPLMWAHAEYIKLLRSVADGQVFDRIGIVAERYLGQRGRTDLEICKPMHRVSTISAGEVLRIQTPSPFRVRWTLDDWQTFRDAPSTATGFGIHFGLSHTGSYLRFNACFADWRVR